MKNKNRNNKRPFSFVVFVAVFLISVPVLSNYYQIVREQVDYDRFARGSIGLTLYMMVGGLYEAAESSYKTLVTA